MNMIVLVEVLLILCLAFCSCTGKLSYVSLSITENYCDRYHLYSKGLKLHDVKTVCLLIITEV